MAYIPKNRIKTGLVSNGEYIIAVTGKTYYGYYHALYDGRFYTGKTQYDFPILELTKPGNSTSDILTTKNVNETLSIPVNSNQYSYVVYNALSIDEPLPKILPNLYIPIATDDDIEVGEFTRYFVKKVNENIYVEINKEQYNNFQSQNPEYFWEIYNTISIPWNITGEVEQTYNTNKNMIELWEKNNNQLGLGAYLQYNYLEFYQYIPQENLSTPGNELVTLTGKDYIGDYHINQILGPMEGKIHSDKSHKRLFYKKFQRQDKQIKTTFGLKTPNDVIVGFQY
jgi:hypothetical protein